jgi:hypothetical protein
VQSEQSAFQERMFGCVTRVNANIAANHYQLLNIPLITSSQNALVVAQHGKMLLLAAMIAIKKKVREPLQRAGCTSTRNQRSQHIYHLLQLSWNITQKIK